MNRVNIDYDNVLSPVRRQAFIWTNAAILLIWTLGANVSEIFDEILTYSLNKMHLKIWEMAFWFRPNVLIYDKRNVALYPDQSYH